MKDPELRSPTEWADDFRESAADADTQSEGGCMNARTLSVWDCRELADRVDDLTEAIDLLKLVLWPYEESERIKQIHARSDALLARYQED